mgnify:CR=1 FL=1
MQWFIDALREHVELALFLSLAVGYVLGKIRIGGFQVGSVLGTLVAGLLIGQVGVTVPAAMRTVFFLMFLFAIGYRIGPQFFRSLRSSALPQVVLSTLLCATGLGLTWVMAPMAPRYSNRSTSTPCPRPRSRMAFRAISMVTSPRSSWCQG